MGLFIITMIIFIGCTTNEKYDSRINEFWLDFLENNNLEVISSFVFKDEEVILLRNRDEFGIESFYINKEKDEIEYDISKVDILSGTEKIKYAQITGMSKCYIGIFIDDEQLAEDKRSIEVTYKDEGKGNRFVFHEETTKKDKTVVVSYVGHGKERD